jgi:hypothetical protein
LSLASAALEVSGSDGFIAAAAAGVVVTGAGKVATSVVLTIEAVVFCCFVGGSFGVCWDLFELLD